jgi:hypothetical protein
VTGVANVKLGVQPIFGVETVARNIVHAILGSRQIEGAFLLKSAKKAI